MEQKKALVVRSVLYLVCGGVLYRASNKFPRSYKRRGKKLATLASVVNPINVKASSPRQKLGDARSFGGRASGWFVRGIDDNGGY